MNDLHPWWPLTTLFEHGQRKIWLVWAYFGLFFGAWGGPLVLTSRQEASYGQRYPCPAFYSFWVEVGLQRGSGPDRGQSPVEWGDFLSFHPFIPIGPSLCLSIRPITPLFIRPSIRPSIHPCVYLSVHPKEHRFIRPSVYLFLFSTWLSNIRFTVSVII